MRNNYHNTLILIAVLSALATLFIALYFLSFQSPKAF